MVITQYLLILLPIIIYLGFTALEIWLTYRQLRGRKTKRRLFIQASTEVTHTILVFAYAQFMIAFSALLVVIAKDLYAPVAVLMASLLIRASLYLMMFSHEESRRSLHGALLATYILGLGAIVWGLFVVVRGIIQTHFTPDTASVGLVLSFGLPALIIFLVPIILVYKNALTAK